MPDPYRLEGELLPLLSRPQYASIYDHRNEFRIEHHHMRDRRDPKKKMADDPVSTPEYVAHKAAWDVFNSHGMLNPVEVVELPGPLQLYRAHEGGERLDSAGTLGRWWFDKRIIQEIWNLTERYPGDDRKQTFMEFLRAANFISRKTNAMKEIVVMQVPTGWSLVLIQGKGDWRALKTAPDAKVPILNKADIIDKLKTMPIPGTIQYFVPLFQDSWIKQVPRLSSKWPFYS